MPNVNLQSDVPWRLIEREGRTMQCNAGLYFLLSPPDINFASLSVKNCRASQASSALIQIWQMEQNTIESCEKICSFFLVLDKWIPPRLQRKWQVNISTSTIPTMQAKTLTPHMNIQRYWCTKGKYDFHFLRTTLMFEVGALGPVVQSLLVCWSVRKSSMCGVTVWGLFVGLRIQLSWSIYWVWPISWTTAVSLDRVKCLGSWSAICSGPKVIKSNLNKENTLRPSARPWLVWFPNPLAAGKSDGYPV